MNNDRKSTILANARYAFGRTHNNLMFPNFGPEYQLLAMCLEEFYGVENDKIFYKSKGKTFNTSNEEVIDWTDQGKSIYRKWEFYNATFNRNFLSLVAKLGTTT